MEPNGILGQIRARLSFRPTQQDTGAGILRDAVQVLPKGASGEFVTILPRLNYAPYPAPPSGTTIS
jgi:hypothetical protein